MQNLRDFVRQTLLEAAGKMYWGVAGAGIVFVCPEEQKVFLQKRSSEVMGGAGQWAFPGGGIHPKGKEERKWVVPIPERHVLPDDSPEFYKQAKIEVAEECGSVPKHKVVDSYLYHDLGFKYRTFIATVTPKTKKAWHPEAEEESAWESTNHGWATLEQFGQLNLFFGFTPELITKVKKAMTKSTS